jgi:PAS domain-containing protein
VTSRNHAGSQPIELILLRQVASYLDMPIFLVDASGQLLYYNEPAEPLLGVRFDEVGPMAVDDWIAAFRPGEPSGQPLPKSEVPVIRAIEQGQPVHESLRIAGLDGVHRVVDVTALPLRGQAGQLLGGIAFFWLRDGA